MNIALILGSGIGSRLKNSEKIPKQFIEIAKKPIIVHTIEKFLLNKNIDHVVVSCHPDWIEFLKKYFKKDEVHIIKGGKTRNESIFNGIKYIEKTQNPKADDIIITHDSVRMFVSDRIINENIKQCIKHNAVDTVVPTTDTIIKSSDKKYIDEIPNRDFLYNGQTPQTFKFSIINKAYKTENHNSTDACSIIVKNKISNVALVMGDYENFKITTNFDLDYAKKVIQEND